MSEKTRVVSSLNNTGKEVFSSRLGFILACVGGSIGLGNVWKFPYMTGQYGGASFLIAYLVMIVVIATPILMVEVALGRKTGMTYTGALKLLFPGKRIYLLGIIGVVVMLLVMSFYSGFTGFILAYLVRSVTGTYMGQDAVAIGADFGAFTANWPVLLFWMAVVLVITGLIVGKGIKSGIEKASKIMMPLLAVLMVALAIYSCTLPGASAGLNFYLNPDFSKLTPLAIIGAANQAIFSIGCGAGNKVIFGAYLDRKRTLTSTTLWVAGGDTLAAIIAGFIVFPAIFAFGISPTAGPTLVFITLPTVFAQMGTGQVLGAVFYIFLFFACITSTISLTEGIVSYLLERLKWSRIKTTTIVCLAIFVLGVFQMLSFGPLKDVMILGKTIFSLTDWLTASILQPFGGLFMLVLFAWVMKPDALLNEINLGEGMKLGKIFNVSVKYIAPAGLLLVWLFLLGIL